MEMRDMHNVKVVVNAIIDDYDYNLNGPIPHASLKEVNDPLPPAEARHVSSGLRVNLYACDWRLPPKPYPMGG